MELITSISQVKAGDQIVCVRYDKITILEYLCQHPHNPKYFIVINEWEQPEMYYIPDFLKGLWYRYDSSTSKQLDQMVIDNLTRKIEKLKKRITSSVTSSSARSKRTPSDSCSNRI